MTDFVEIGRYLRSERERKGMSLRQIQELTKIRVKYLEAIESGDFDVIPGEVYAKGFLRSYAECLGLDGWELVARYKEAIAAGQGQTEAAQGVKAQEGRKLDSQDDIKRKMGVPRSARRYRVSNWRSLVLAVVILVVIIYLAIQLGLTLRRPEKPEEPAAYSPPVTETVPEPSVPETLQLSGQPSKPGRAEKPSPSGTVETPSIDEAPAGRDQPGQNALPVEKAVSGQNAPATHETPGALEAPEAPETQPVSSAETEPAEPVVVEAVASERCWIEVIADGVRVYSRTMLPGETAVWKADRELRIKFGNAKGVSLVVNGREIGSPGEGVVTRTFETETKTETRMDTGTETSP